MYSLRQSRGFTLVELLVVVAVVGILAAIAVPQFSTYRQRGFDARAQADLRNAAMAQEALFAADAKYLSCKDKVCVKDLPGFHLSDGVELTMAAKADSFSATAKHVGGSKTWEYESTKGGMLP